MRKINSKLRKYLKFLKDDQDYDYYFLITLERYKLKRMIEFFEKEGNQINSLYKANQMRLAVKLIDIILEEDKIYNAWFQDKAPMSKINIKNLKHYNIKILDNYPLKREGPLYDFLLWDIRCHKALYLYNKLRYYNMYTWWD